MKYLSEYSYVIFIYFSVLFGIDYDTHIQPILNDNCLSCHGNSGGLDLSNYTNLMAGGNSGAVIISGDHLQSVLWQKIESGIMPPGLDEDLDLTDAMVELIGSWIDDGALENKVDDIDLILVEGNVYIDSPNYHSGVMIIFHLPVTSTDNDVDDYVIVDTVYSNPDGSFYHLADTGFYDITYQLEDYTQFFVSEFLITDENWLDMRIIINAE